MADDKAVSRRGDLDGSGKSSEKSTRRVSVSEQLQRQMTPALSFGKAEEAAQPMLTEEDEEDDLGATGGDETMAMANSSVSSGGEEHDRGQGWVPSHEQVVQRGELPTTVTLRKPAKGETEREARETRERFHGDKWDVWRDSKLSEITEQLQRNYAGKAMHTLSEQQQKLFYAAFNIPEVLENLALTWIRGHERVGESISVVLGELERALAVKTECEIQPLRADIEALHQTIADNHAHFQEKYHNVLAEQVKEVQYWKGQLDSQRSCNDTLQAEVTRFQQENAHVRGQLKQVVKKAECLQGQMKAQGDQIAVVSEQLLQAEMHIKQLTVETAVTASPVRLGHSTPKARQLGRTSGRSVVYDREQILGEVCPTIRRKQKSSIG